MRKSEWTPITIIDSKDDPPNDGGVTLRRHLSATPDADWRGHFRNVGTSRQGSRSFVDLATDPLIVGDVVHWTVPQRDAEGGSESIAKAVAAANDRYADQLSED